MGCCKSKETTWDKDFKETDLSSNRCDAHWENVRGLEATFGMGSHHVPCARFGVLPGVIRCQVGFSGGTTLNPSYEDIGDHTQAINVEYDPKRLGYEHLLKVFFNYHDIFLRTETPEHRSTLFYRAEEQKTTAEEFLIEEQTHHEHAIVTQIVPFTTFINSEEQHFILQSNRTVMDKLKKHIHPYQMGYSHLASRLDGYLAGYAPPEDFDKELPDLHIPEHLAVLVRKMCQENQIPEPGADHMNDWG